MNRRRSGRRSRIRAALLLGAILALGGPAHAQPASDEGVPAAPADGYPRQPGLDVLHYEVSIGIPDSGATITGRAAILYEAVVVELNELRLDLGSAMVVDSVTIDGLPAAHRREGDRVAIRVPGTPAGARRMAVVWYHGEPADGLIVGQTRHGRRSIFADNWADRAHHWLPSVDHPADKASVAFEVTAPAALEVVANGMLVERTVEGGRARTRWVESAEIPVYGMVIGATDFAIQTAGIVDGVEITHWTFPEDSAAGAIAFARSTEILAFYDSLFGPYPYDKLAHVQSATKFGGMENPSAIFYSQQMIGEALSADADGRDALTGLVAHETVHQWFGDAVTEADWNHLWLSEGFAEYFDAVFFEFHGGSRGKGAAERTRQMRLRADDVREFETGGARAIYAPGAQPGGYESLLTPANYEKGAWVLHMLRRLVGDEAFFRGIRAYYGTLRDGTAWTDDFTRIMEAVSGRPLDGFFAQWVARPGMPALRAEVVGEGSARRLRVEQLQGGAPYVLSVDVELRTEEGSLRRVVEMDGASSAEIPLDVEGEVRVVLDPDGWLLFVDRSSAME